MTEALEIEAYKQESDIVLITLLDIDYGGETVLRVTDNQEEVEHGGYTYMPYAFRFVLEERAEGRPPSARLTIDNTDRTIVQAIRMAAGDVFITAQIVTSLDLETAEYGPITAKLSNCTYNKDVVSGQLLSSDGWYDRVPGYQFTPPDFPGLFG